MQNQSGQVLLIILLVITVGLGVGLSIVQRSITNVSTSTKVEESQRAFSAAEAGIERAISENKLNEQFDFNQENQSGASVDASKLIPGANQALETPNLTKEEVDQAYLSDPNSLSPFYTQTSLEVYWGKVGITDANEKPALEINIIYQSAGVYLSNKFYLDPNTGRSTGNGFCNTDGGGNCSGSTSGTASFSCSDSLPTISTTSGANRQFFCKATLSNLLPTLILTRLRLLYSSSSHPIAYMPTGGCPVGCSLPPQARIVTSTGSSGSTQRRVQLFIKEKIVPFYFDYAIFSKAEIKK